MEVLQQADNYGTNVLEFFSQFINAPTTSSLYQSAFGVSTLLSGAPASDPTMAFEEDCANGTLPTVSWLLPTSVASEHPAFLPAAGAQFVASKIEALAANEDPWNSTVLILNYDENDGFFDHVPPITPPKGTAEEFTSLSSPGGTPGGGLNLGSGFRVPAVVISPWTVGGNVCSDPLDHTSVLRFLERVTGVNEPNISDWRRSTFNDFTTAFQSAPASAPSIPAATASATAAQLAYQKQQSMLPLPAFPGAVQTPPMQQAGR
ncbi:MAG TPA: alkaline phosphatase family protein [Acidimicrobiales bacterium]|nr:alkaline phosphatase family protein [Acidimicrobiales bacterium]